MTGMVVVVTDRDCQGPFGIILTDHKAIQMFFDITWQQIESEWLVVPAFCCSISFFGGLTFRSLPKPGTEEILKTLMELFGGWQGLVAHKSGQTLAEEPSSRKSSTPVQRFTCFSKMQS